MKALVILISIFGFFSPQVLAQNGTLDSASLAHAMKEQRIGYQNTVAANSLLNNGSLYKEQIYRTRTGDVPYYLSDDWIEGSIAYGGQLFEQIDLQYDIVGNKIISHPFYSLIKMELVYERIERFTLQGHTFVRLRELAKDNNFYDQLVTGSAMLYALRKKEVLEELSSGTVAHLFVDKTKYFIAWDGKFIEVKNRRDVLKVFSANKTQIKRQLPGGGSFRKDPEGSLKKSVLYYNQHIAR